MLFFKFFNQLFLVVFNFNFLVVSLALGWFRNAEWSRKSTKHKFNINVYRKQPPKAHTICENINETC